MRHTSFTHTDKGASAENAEQREESKKAREREKKPHQIMNKHGTSFYDDVPTAKTKRTRHRERMHAHGRGVSTGRTRARSHLVVPSVKSSIT